MHVLRPGFITFHDFFSLLKILNVYAASEKFAELILILESNGDLETVKEKLNAEYLEIPIDMVKRVLAGQHFACLFSKFETFFIFGGFSIVPCL